MNFTDPQGRTLIVNSPDGSTPSESELDQMFAQKYGQPKGGSDAAIAQRPSAIADLTKNPTTWNHPLGAVLRTLGGANELYQGVPASIALDLQKGQPQNILPNLGKVLTGQRPAQYGDVFQGAGVPAPLAAAGGLATDLALSPGGADMMANAAKGIGKPIANIGNAIKDNIITPKTLDNHIVSTYAQAVNPAIGKITNAAKMNEFQSKTVDAMKSIANNPDLKFENPTTGAMESRLPQSRMDAFQGVVQTKQKIFDQYNSMQQAATGKQAMIDVPTIAKQALGDIKNSRQYKLYAPSEASEANQVMDRLIKSGPASPQDVQDDIAFLNQKMKGYYQKGDYNASNIYANYAANLRSSLDSTIEKTLGQSGYQELKNQYSSLKYVESDLAKAGARQLKSTTPGIGESFSNPIALAEMARGLFTGSVAEFDTGMAIKGFATAQKALANPDWRIANMFKNIAKIKGK